MIVMKSKHSRSQVLVVEVQVEEGVVPQGKEVVEGAGRVKI
jgi:hypothetical protein